MANKLGGVYSEWRPTSWFGWRSK